MTWINKTNKRESHTISQEVSSNSNVIPRDKVCTTLTDTMVSLQILWNKLIQKQKEKGASANNNIYYIYWIHLVFASGTSGRTLGVGGTSFGIGLLVQHGLVALVSALRILVSGLFKNENNHQERERIVRSCRGIKQTLNLIITNVKQNIIYITNLSGVDTRGIGGVTLESLKGVKVTSGSGRVGIPLVVHVLLGVLIPQFVVVFAVFESTGRGGGGCCGRCCGGGGCLWM